MDFMFHATSTKIRPSTFRFKRRSCTVISVVTVMRCLISCIMSPIRRSFLTVLLSLFLIFVAVLTNFSPVIVYGNVASTFVIPTVYFALMLIPGAGSRLRTIFPSALWPRLVCNPEEFLYSTLTKLSSGVGMLIYFGLQNPLVGITILVSLVVECFLWRALVGRCMLHRYPEIFKLSEAQVLTVQ